MKNLVFPENGGSLHEFTSQYHHESRALNLMSRDPTLVWFSNNLSPFPQHVTIKLKKKAKIHRVGVFVHGENNQNPKQIKIAISNDDKKYTDIWETPVEKKSGDVLYTPKEPIEAEYIRYVVLENYGGSGVHISKVYAFGEFEDK
mmetsp:Transcript_7072/g.10403  ORF Transcript_7072/g.10403 Transcript_7072/m.10403 type:complete len:145 (+) Transcript_7072:32-466(+)